MQKKMSHKNFETVGRYLKNKEGITLIALVVTIIVLLILARDKLSNTNRRTTD